KVANAIGQRPNNSFKPNLLRYTKAMAEKACHGFGSTTQVGLTQALGAKGEIRGDDNPNSLRQPEGREGCSRFRHSRCLQVSFATLTPRQTSRRPACSSGHGNYQ